MVAFPVSPTPQTPCLVLDLATVRRLGVVVTVTLTLIFATSTGSSSQLPAKRLATRTAAWRSNGTAATTSATVPSRRSTGPTIVAKGIFYDLVSDGSDLLAARLPSPGDATGRSFVVRVDPANGRRLAMSPALYNVQDLVVVASRVWVIATAGWRLERFELLQLDVHDLRPMTRVSLNAPVPSLVGWADLLWLAEGCDLERLDPANGATLVRVRFSSADCVEEGVGYTLAISVEGNYLIAAPEPGDGALMVLDAHSGRVLRRRPNLAGGEFVSLVAADGYLWVLNGSAGLQTPLNIYRLPGLQLVKTMAPRSLSCSTPQVFSGCPGWIEYLDGVIWGGGGLIGCANPKTLSVDATAHGSGFTDLVTVGGRTYGIWPPDPNNPSNATDIVRFTPPAACGAIARG